MRGLTSLAVAVAITLSASIASAQLVNETFTYPDGNLVGNDGWLSHSGTAPVTVASAKAVVNMATGSQDVNRPIGATLGAGGTFYAALDVSMTAAAPLDILVPGGTTVVSTYFAHFKDTAGTTGTGFRGRIFATGIAGSDYTYGLNASSSSPTAPGAVWATGYAYGSLQRVVVSFSFDTGLSKLWVDPVNELSTSISHTGGSLLAIAAFALRQSSEGAGADPTHTVDNLCVDTTFSGALLCPEPGTAILIGLGTMLLFRRRR